MFKEYLICVSAKVGTRILKEVEIDRNSSIEQENFIVVRCILRESYQELILFRACFDETSTVDVCDFPYFLVIMG